MTLADFQAFVGAARSAGVAAFEVDDDGCKVTFLPPQSALDMLPPVPPAVDEDEALPDQGSGEGELQIPPLAKLK